MKKFKKQIANSFDYLGKKLIRYEEWLTNHSYVDTAINVGIDAGAAYKKSIDRDR